MYEGVYALHLERLYARGIDPANVRVYWSETFLNETADVVQDAASFVGLDPVPVSSLNFSMRYNSDGDNRGVDKVKQQKEKQDDRLRLTDELKKRMYSLFEPFDHRLMQILKLRSAPFQDTTPPWRSGNWKPDITSNADKEQDSVFFEGAEDHRHGDHHPPVGTNHVN